MLAPPPAIVYDFVLASYFDEPAPIVEGVPTSPLFVNRPSD
jgi:hypothetical protein